MLLLYPFCRWEIWSSKTLSVLPKVTVSRGSRIEMRSFWLKAFASICSLYTKVWEHRKCDSFYLDESRKALQRRWHLNYILTEELDSARMRMKKGAWKTEERAREKDGRVQGWWNLQCGRSMAHEWDLWVKRPDLGGATNKRRWKTCAAMLRHQWWTRQGFWNTGISDLTKSKC